MSRLWGVVVGHWRCRVKSRILVDGRSHVVLHDWRLCSGFGGGNRIRTLLAAVTSVGKLVIVKATSQLGLFQVSGNVLIRHLLETGLEEIHFLQKQALEL